jgi:hypothetical protein
MSVFPDFFPPSCWHDLVNVVHDLGLLKLLVIKKMTFHWSEHESARHFLSLLVIWLVRNQIDSDND